MVSGQPDNPPSLLVSINWQTKQCCVGLCFRISFSSSPLLCSVFACSYYITRNFVNMAVDAQRLQPLFSSHHFNLPTREMSTHHHHHHHHHHHAAQIDPNGLLYNPMIGFGYGAVPSLPAHTSLFNPIYSISPTATVSPAVAPAIQLVDSSVTFNSENASSLRKRSREDSVLHNPPAISLQRQRHKHHNNSLMFLGQDLSFNLQHHQLDIDRLISNHVERMRMEIEEKRKRQERMIIEAIEDGLMKRVRAKEEEMNHIGKLNLYLEEKVKTLCVENQIWRDLAMSNEATANALRSNLQQVLASVEGEGREGLAVADDAQSCCGSSGSPEDEEEAQDGKRWRRRMCRRCGKEEASVLMLPCRHMCLCSVCGSSQHTCPLCKSPKNATLHINLSSSN